jgi:hypothetical protein
MRPGVVFLFASVMGLPVVSQADTILVGPSGAADHTTVSAAIEAASAGDVVEVAAGTYTENLDFLGRAITVASADGPGVTFLVGDGTGPVVRLDNGEGPGSVLIGFDISGGDGGFDGGFDGGCIHVAGGSPVLEDLVLHDCVSHLGAGLLLVESGSEITGVTIYGCTSSAGEGNNGGYGGGLYAYESDLVLDGLLVYDNVAVRGGGMMFGYGTTEVIRSTIAGNEAVRGGGLSFLGGTHELTSSDVDGNTATAHSGGIWANVQRSEERRVGKECGLRCRSRWSPYH